MVAVMGFEPNITSVKEMCPNLLDDTAVYGAGERNRTLKGCLQGSCFTIKLRQLVLVGHKGFEPLSYRL